MDSTSIRRYLFFEKKAGLMNEDLILVKSELDIVDVQSVARFFPGGRFK